MNNDLKIRISGNHGWTLIELAFTVAVMAILASIAVPAFNGQVVKSRRADGHALLYEAAQRQQQFYTTNTAYTDTVGDGGLEMSSTSQAGYYTLSIAATNTTYSLTATRAAAQTSDHWCENLTLTHLNVKGTSGGSWSTNKCW